MEWENSPILHVTVAWLSCTWDRGENEGMGCRIGSDAMLRFCLFLLLQWRPDSFQVGKTGFSPAPDDGMPVRIAKPPLKALKNNTTKTIKRKTQKWGALTKSVLGTGILTRLELEGNSHPL